MLTDIVRTDIGDGYIELTMQGGDFTDGDMRPTIKILLPNSVDPRNALEDIQRMVLTWAHKEISSHL